MTIKHADISSRIGAVQDSLVSRAISALSAHLGP
jgi:hypothetical protein